MRKLLLIVALMLVVSVGVQGQIRYAVSDSIAVSVTAIDSTFSQRWETVNIKFVGCSGWVKFAMSASDTTGFKTGAGTAPQQWTFLQAGEVLYLERNASLGIPGLYRLRAKAASGTGVMYLIGTKAVLK